MDTIWKKIARTLNANGIDVYPPATKVGECTEPYVVLKKDGSSQISSFSSEQHYYTFLIYVPKNEYTKLDEVKNRVKSVVADNLFPLLMPTGQETPDFYDDSVKAHMVSILYRNNVRNRHL